MLSVRIVVSLLKVPRLFASLLLFPIFGALILVAIQLAFSGTALLQISEAKSTSADSGQNPEGGDSEFLRFLLFGAEDPALTEPLLCLWSRPSENQPEFPPSKECVADSLDIALHISDNLKVNPENYLRLVRGNVFRLHVCQSCKPDFEIFLSEQGSKVRVNSIYGFMLYKLVTTDKKLIAELRELRRQRNVFENQLGEVELNLPALKGAIQISSLEISIIAVLNITCLAVMALWLGLKAHRKVLEYFSKSGALLPMVAATGKSSFYIALWLITLLRVAAFLLASVPLLVMTLNQADSAESVMDVRSFYFYIWIISLIVSLSLATIIASISDLKNRHEILSVMYKVIPLLLSAFGGLLWLLTFFGTGEMSGVIRNFITACPIIGTGPVVLAPIGQVKDYVLIIHTFLSLILIIWLLRKNTHWFAAHLEEI